MILLILVILVITDNGIVVCQNAAKMHNQDNVYGSTKCKLEWRLMFDCCKNKQTIKGDIQRLFRAINEGKEIKVVLKIGYATRFPGKINHLRIENGEVIAFITKYLSDDFQALRNQKTAFREWITISTNGTMKIKRYDVVKNKVVNFNQFVRTRWFADESCGNKEAYRPDKRRKRSLHIPEEELGGPISVVAVKDNVTYSFIMDGSKIDYQKMYGQIKHKMRQILFPVGSFLHNNPFTSIKWFQKGCWRRLSSTNLGADVYRSMINGSVPNIGNEVRMLFRGHRKGQSSGFNGIRYEFQNITAANTVYHYMLGTWKKYADHTKWECQSVTATGQKRKTKFLSLAEWFVSQTADTRGSCTWMMDDLQWKMILQIDKNGKTITGSHSCLWRAVENGASIRVALHQGPSYVTFELNEIALDLRREAIVAKVLQCGKDIKMLPGFKRSWKDADKQLAIITVQSKGPTRLTLWNVGKHSKGNLAELPVQQFWYVRS